MLSEEVYIKNYKKILLIPLILFLVSSLFLISQVAITGEFIDKDISLDGGISLEIYTQEEINIENLETNFLEEFSSSDVYIRKLGIGLSQKAGYILETTIMDMDPVLNFAVENFNVEEVEIERKRTGPSFGKSALVGMIYALIFAFVLMGIVVFITFRKVVPSLAVILSAGLDLWVTFAIISFLGVRLSTAGIAAFLMVVGYSIDTDILLTTRLMKRKVGTIFERLKDAFKTGLTMTTTTLVALLIAFTLTTSLVFKQMFGIIIIALIVDLISTWCMNAGLLIWYLEKNENH